MINKLKKFEHCFEAMMLKLTNEGIVNHRGDIVGFFDAYGDFHSKDENLIELVRDFLSRPADFTFKKAEPKKKKKRARKEDGTFQADDPSTPDINEAYEQD